MDGKQLYIYSYIIQTSKNIRWSYVFIKIQFDS